ncbi:MAG TPA: hypothetical protein VGF67_17345 [Ktedonobacteraceae bacterium]|jgi:hypothetical protein
MNRQTDKLNRLITPQDMLDNQEFVQAFEKMLIRKLLARSAGMNGNTSAELRAGRKREPQGHLIGWSWSIASVSIILIALGFLTVTNWGRTESMAAVSIAFGIACLSLILINIVFSCILIKHVYQADHRHRTGSSGNFEKT